MTNEEVLEKCWQALTAYENEKFFILYVRILFRKFNNKILSFELLNKNQQWKGIIFYKSILKCRILSYFVAFCWTIYCQKLLTKNDNANIIITKFKALNFKNFFIKIKLF